MKKYKNLENLISDKDMQLLNIEKENKKDISDLKEKLDLFSNEKNDLEHSCSQFKKEISILYNQLE